ncbi:MAG: acyltransferase family protein [Vulcanimicrobiota bacterium]
MKYRSDVDGLRAVAVIAVLMYHAHLGFPGGYVGVDVFFVISGFLITSILLKKLRDGTFSYLDFWERRVKRLVPALFVVTVFTALMSYLILLPSHLVDLGGSLIAQPLLLANVYFCRVVQGGYFGDPPEIRPLLHTWSLGVEEQFYVLFPLFLMICWRSLYLRTHLGRVLLGLAVASLALGVFLTPIKGVAAFFNLPTRAWELLIGSLLVFSPAAPKWLREGVSWLGALLIAYAVFYFHKETPFPGTAALVPCLGAALLIWSNEAGHLTRVGRLLSHPLMVKIGLASYSIYLWHWPFMAFGDYTGLLYSIEAKVLALLIGFWAGFLSWKYVETPFRGHTWLKTRRSVLLLFLAYVVVCGTIGFWYRANNGFRENWDLQMIQVHEPRMDYRSLIHEVNPLATEPNLREIGDLSRDEIDFLLWGDSHAMSLAPVMDELARSYRLKGLMVTRSITPPLVSWNYADGVVRCDQGWKNGWAALLERTLNSQASPVVFMHAHWPGYFSPSFEEDFTQTLALLEQLGARPYVVQSVLRCWGPLEGSPYRYEPLVRRWPILQSTTPPTRLETRSEWNQRNSRLAKLLAKHDKLIALDPASVQYSWVSLNPGGLPSYKDAAHLNDFGALRLREYFEDVFRDLSMENEGFHSHAE